jgi:RNA-directed DNA polymerase
MEQCATVLSNSTRPQWILEGDIKSCFDKISHSWLLSHIPMEKPILNTWLKAGYMDKSVLYPTEDGTPQGGTVTLPTNLLCRRCLHPAACNRGTPQRLPV